MQSIPFSRSKIIAIADCNSFYASCEQLFQPHLRHRPVVVLSNNDGCVVARSAMAKQLGIQMGVPVFKLKTEIAHHRVLCFSSNYSLYGDMSQRVMDSLAQFSPEVEVYSIDECWLDLTGFPHRDIHAYAHEIRSKVVQWTGISISIGVSSSKTLAKVANKIAKQNPSNGVFCLEACLEESLSQFPVEDLWGIGRQYCKWLNSLGVRTALDFRNLGEGVIRKKMGVVGVRMLYELHGHSCLPLELVSKPKQETCVSRSFGKPVSSLVVLQEALSTYASRAAAKLRQQHQVAESMVVFARTSPFKADYYRRSAIVSFPIATSYTPEIVSAVRQAAVEIYQDGRAFKKAGVIMLGLCPESMVQGHLWEREDPDWQHRQRLMGVMDQINTRFGRGAIDLAASGLRQSWQLRSEHRSPRYTTRWSDLPMVVC